MITICKLASIEKECLLLSDNWGPYYTIDQCIDRIDRMHSDSLRTLPTYKLEYSHCRKVPGQTYGSKKYPNSSSES